MCRSGKRANHLVDPDMAKDNLFHCPPDGFARFSPEHTRIVLRIGDGGIKSCSTSSIRLYLTTTETTKCRHDIECLNWTLFWPASLIIQPTKDDLPDIHLQGGGRTSMAPCSPLRLHATRGRLPEPNQDAERQRPPDDLLRRNASSLPQVTSLCTPVNLPKVLLDHNVLVRRSAHRCTYDRWSEECNTASRLRRPVGSRTR